MEEELKESVEIINTATGKSVIENKPEQLQLPNSIPVLPKSIKIVIFSNLTANGLLCKISKLSKATR